MTLDVFMQIDNTLIAYAHQSSTTSETSITYVKGLLKNSLCLVKPIVVIDNAFFHKLCE